MHAEPTLICIMVRQQELAFSMAIIICVSRLGSVAAFNSQTALINDMDVVKASFVGTGIMGVSMSTCCIVAAIDKRADVIDRWVRSTFFPKQFF